MPGVEVLAGTAEQIPLPDCTVDAVLVAQAFHWFDVPAAAAEIDRVLIAGGALAAIRNEWDRSVEWVDELQKLVRERPGHTPRHPSWGWREQLEATGRFTAASEQVLANPARADLDTLLARVASLSFIAAMEACKRARLLADVRALVTRSHVIGPDGRIETPYRTQVVWCRSLGSGD